MSGAANLFKLQRIDSELDARRARLGEIDKLLGADETLQRARARVEASASATSAARRAHGLIRDEIEQVTNKRQNSEQRLYSGAISNPKELQDLQSEVKSLSHRLQVLEERELEALIDLEDAETIEAEDRDALDTLSSSWDSEQGDLAGEKAGLDREVERLSDEREAALIPVKSADRDIYDHLRQTKAGLAVTRLQDGVCSVCGMAPSAARIQSARSSLELVRCGNCGRILYVD